MEEENLEGAMADYDKALPQFTQNTRPFRIEEVVMQDKELQKKVVSKYMSNLARLSHQKHPRGRDYYVKMGKMGKRKPKVV